MFDATIRKIDGAWYVERVENAYTKPERVTVRWRVQGIRSNGWSHRGPELVDGLAVKLTERDTFSAYKDGGWLIFDTEHEGTATTEPLPCPKGIRPGTDTRYERGRWEKYLKTKGWVAA